MAHRSRLGQPHAQVLPGVRGGCGAQRQEHAPRADRGTRDRAARPRAAAAFGDRLRARRRDRFRRGPRWGQAAAAGPQGDRWRRALRDRGAPAPGTRGGAAGAHRRTARLGQRLPLPRGRAPTTIALPTPPHGPAAPARFLSESDDRRSRVLGAVVHLTLDEGYDELLRSADRAVRGDVDGIVPQALPQQGAVLPRGVRRVRGRNDRP